MKSNAVITGLLVLNFLMYFSLSSKVGDPGQFDLAFKIQTDRENIRVLHNKIEDLKIDISEISDLDSRIGWLELEH